MEVELIVMRLADMHRVHPNQDNSRKCSVCGHRVGIYPSGREVLKNNRDVKLICNECYGGGWATPAPGALDEPRQSVDRNDQAHD